MGWPYLNSCHVRMASCECWYRVGETPSQLWCQPTRSHVKVYRFHIQERRWWIHAVNMRSLWQCKRRTGRLSPRTDDTGAKVSEIRGEEIIITSSFSVLPLFFLIIPMSSSPKLPAKYPQLLRFWTQQVVCPPIVHPTIPTIASLTTIKRSVTKKLNFCWKKSVHTSFSHSSSVPLPPRWLLQPAKPWSAGTAFLGGKEIVSTMLIVALTSHALITSASSWVFIIHNCGSLTSRA